MFTQLITHQISEFIHSFPESDLDYMPGLGLTRGSMNIEFEFSCEHIATFSG